MSCAYRRISRDVYNVSSISVLTPPSDFADVFHTAHPSVTCEFKGIDGLQREYGHDRVRWGCGWVMASGLDRQRVPGIYR